MTWYHIKFVTVSGKPDEYIRANSIKTIQEFLHNHYINSSSFNISENDINNIKYKKIDENKDNIEKMVKDNIIVSRAIDLTNNGVVYNPKVKSYNIFRKN